MSLACLVCHSAESPSHSFRSHSMSSSDNEGRCSAIANCLTLKPLFPLPSTRSAPYSTSKVTPHPTRPLTAGMTGAPRLVRSHAARDWNFGQAAVM